MHIVSIPLHGIKSRGRKHDFLQKSVGGCIFYDVIDRYADLTRSILFSPEVAQRMPHKRCKVSARSVQRFVGHSRKTHGDGASPPPPLHGRGLNKGVPTEASVTGYQKLVLFYWECVFGTHYADAQSGTVGSFYSKSWVLWLLDILSVCATMLKKLSQNSII